MPLQIALTVGLGLLLASLHVFLRDVAQALGSRVQRLVLLHADRLSAGARAGSLPSGAIELNPLTALVDLYRSALLGGAAEATRGFVALVVAAALLLGARRRWRSGA